MTRYLALGAICGFAVAVLLLAALGRGNSEPAAAVAVSDAGSTDAGPAGLVVQPLALPLKQRLLLPQSFDASKERLRQPQRMPLGAQPQPSNDGG